MDSIDCDFMKEQKWRFRWFFWTGILSKTNATTTKWTMYMILSRLFWFLWHFFGTGLCIWIRINNSSEPKCQATKGLANVTDDNQDDDQEYTSFLGLSLLNLFSYIACTLLLLLFLGPIQGNIIKRNCESFPKILKNIREVMRIAKYEMSEDNQQLLQNNDLDLEVGNVQISKSKRGNCCYRCYSKNLIPRISVGIFVVLIVVFGFLSAYKAHDIDDLWDEYKLLAVLLYLPLPMVTTCFVVTLIKKITRLYKVILDLKDEMFLESKNVMIVSKYIGLLQETVEVMLSKIVSFTLGINLAIFVTTAVICSYEIVQGIKETKTVNNHFAEVDYFLPLSICYGMMFWICRVSDRLMSNIHVKIRLRIRLLLQKLYLDQREQKEPFKELEFVYKTLKEWSPQVYVYGGWKVNYQLLSAIVLFIFTYSIKFYSFDKTPLQCRIV